MSQHWVTPFLEALRATGVVAQAARAAEISSTTAYALRQSDADFANAWDNALEDSYDTLEGEARRRALQGVNEPVVYQGQLTPVWERDANGELVMDTYETGALYPAGHAQAGQAVLGTRPRQVIVGGVPQFLTINKKSDALLQFLLKGYRKRFGTETTELTGKDGAPLQVADASTRAIRVAALLEAARRRKDGTDMSDLA